MNITKQRIQEIVLEEFTKVTEKVVKRGDKYAYISKKGKTLGTHDTKAGAENKQQRSASAAMLVRVQNLTR